MTARRNPYVGLVPYTEADAEWFFGRDQEMRLITANLRAARLTLLYGASGVGKSSVLLAGVLPRLQALVAEHRPVAAGNGRGTLLADRPPIAVTVFREWRDPPLPQLAAAAHAAVADACEDDDIAPWDGTEPFVEWLRMLTAHARTLLVVLDQFEEYFQYHPDETGPGTFGTEFPAVINDRDLRVHFLMSLREDAWARLDRFKGEIPDLFGNYLRIDYLDRAAARDAIVKPLEHFNATAEHPVTIEPELVDAILRDVRTGRLALAEGQATGPGSHAATGGDERVETPYLQLVMERLWEAGTADGGHSLTLATLEELGGASSIVSSHLTDAMATLSPDDQATAADVFGFLVTPSKTKIAHRASDLAYWAQRPEEDVRRVLDDLASGDRRILRRVPPPGDEEVDRYEIFHDVLADAVLEWSGENRQRRQRAAARRERARTRRRRMLWILGALAIIAGIVAAVLVVHHQQANNAQTERDADINAAKQRSRVLARNSESELGFDSERGLLLALAAHGSYGTREAERALGKAFAAARARGAYVDGVSPPCPTCAPRRGTRPLLQPVAFATEDPVFFGADAGGTLSGTRAALSPDGSTLAVIRDGRVELWRPGDGHVGEVPGVRSAVGVAFIGNGKRLAIVTHQRKLLVAAGEGSPRTVAARFEFAAVSADGRYLATAAGRKLRVTPIAHPGAGTPRKLPFLVRALVFSPKDTGLLVLERWSDGKPVRLRWRASRVPVSHTEGAPLPGAFVVAAAAPAAGEQAAAIGRCLGADPAVLSADGSLLLTTAPDGRVSAWSMPGLRLRFKLPRTPGCASVVRVDARGRRLLVASGNVAAVYDSRDGEPVAWLGGHTDAIADASFSPSGAVVATAAADGSARVWDTATGDQLIDLRGRGLGGRVTPLGTVRFTADGRFAVTADENGVARMWDVSTATRHVGGVRRDLPGAGLTDDGHVLVARPDGRILRFSTNGGDPQVVDRLGALASATFSADGTHAVVLKFTGSHPDLSWVALGRPGRIRLKADGFANPILSENGRDVLIWGPSRVRVWHDGRRSRVVPLTKQERRFGETAELSKDGQRVLITTYQGGARIVDVDGGNSVRLHDQSAPRLWGADFSPDGTQLVTFGKRGAFVWDATSGALIAPLGEDVGPVAAAVFSLPAGNDIATLDRHGAIRIFDSASRDETTALAPHPGLNFDFAYNSTTQTALLTGEQGVELRTCGSCQSTDWLLRHAQARLTRTPEQAKAFINKEIGR